MYENRPGLETRSKIVATLGPASWNEPALSNLLRAGVDVCRINGSHADRATIRRLVADVRSAAAALRRHIAVLLDLQGPKIRVGELASPLALRGGDTLTIVMAESCPADGLRVGTTWPEMAADLVVGARLLFADGALSGIVTDIRHECDPAEVDVQIVDGGVLKSHQGINLPGIATSVPSLTEKDLGDVAVGVEAGVDYLALSFVRSAADVVALKERLARLGRPELPVIAKIEKPQAVAAIDEILVVADGVMVARGDLGVEVQLEEVPVLQKRILAAARRHRRLAITATQMLDSMERNPRPTRAETTDVANAILDGTDAVMLSGETATGSHPIEAVRTMDSIARSVESSEFFMAAERRSTDGAPVDVVIRAAVAAVADRPRPLVVFTLSGATAVKVSKTRPISPIFACTPDLHVADRLALCWGVTPVVVERTTSTDAMIASGVDVLRELGHVHVGEEIVVVGGRAHHAGANLLVFMTVTTSGY
ncbi:MAG: pyruvate kinase [Planctomycetes bacterium]|nr:pyruvate kinase [Planctomycetota bacterium]